MLNQCLDLKTALCVAAAVALCGCVTLPGRRLDAGPLARVDCDVHGTPGVRMFGPLVERRLAEDGTTFTAVRPLWSRVHDPKAERTVSDILWPLGMVKVRKGERDWRLFPAFGHDFDLEDGDSRYRWAVFPVLFRGRSSDGNPYFAVFPLGGTLHEFLGRDRIVFALFPAYAYSTVNTLQTHSVLWPFFSRTTGEGVYRFRVWPLYGVSVNEDRWTKRFVMWPFWTSVQYDYPDQKGGGFMLFPLYGQVNVKDRHSRLLLPPLFKYEWAANGHRALNCPWPLVQYRRGDMNKLYFWPVYGHKSVDGERQWFALWPLVSGRRSDLPKQSVNRFQALPLVYYESRRHNTAGVADQDEVAPAGVFARYFKIWPVLSYRREEDHSRFRMLAFWPLKHTPAIERNWAPLWSLYTHERVGATKDTELLWGFYRHRRTGNTRRFSVFPMVQGMSDADRDSHALSFMYGLAGYRREGLHRQFRLLYFLRFGRLPTKDGIERNAQ